MPVYRVCWPQKERGFAPVASRNGYEVWDRLPTNKAQSKTRPASDMREIHDLW